jgi:hypothetical protein
MVHLKVNTPMVTKVFYLVLNKICLTMLAGEINLRKREYNLIAGRR